MRKRVYITSIDANLNRTPVYSVDGSTEQVNGPVEVTMTLVMGETCGPEFFDVLLSSDQRPVYLQVETDTERALKKNVIPIARDVKKKPKTSRRMLRLVKGDLY